MTVILIKTERENVFGAIATDKWEQNSNKNINSSFIFFYKGDEIFILKPSDNFQ